MASRRILGATLVFLLALAPSPLEELFHDDFSDPELRHWIRTSAGDFNERKVEVSEDARLRIRVDTMGTRAGSVKYLGARLRDGYEVGEGICVSAALDWNGQANGSYLGAAVIVAGASDDGNPLEQPDWLAVEYVGVPPGRNARMQLRARANGRVRTLEDEGWPDEQRAGRRIGVVRVELEITADRLRLWENGTLLYEGASGPSLTRAFLHLQLSSHSNYRAREVYFDDVRVIRGPCVDEAVTEPSRRASGVSAPQGGRLESKAHLR